ncbi:MAG: DUF748 domain-containing protein [Algoriphagus sp.]|uniref:DUF748 domain-containing protein n=1 Tax=Algoriphagus sp. TaxID=1872435 RepID=UPI00181E532D|nr:DUF748 domain-containing protein [Algoriphagus sp.]NVJ85676.1 DUF748 domain-containing protein [Algoriphagus sp.]
MKKILFGLAFLFLLIMATILYLSSMIGELIQNQINTNSNRSYDLKFEDLSVNLLSQKVELERIMIIPLKKDESNSFSGSLEKMILNNLHIWDFLTDKQVIIDELILQKPAFRLTLTNEKSESKKGSHAFQKFFEDIISRGEIKNLKVINGTAELFLEGEHTKRIGGFTDLTIQASGIQTDKKILRHIIPFELEEIKSSLKNLHLELNEGKVVKIRAITLDLLGQLINVEDISFYTSEDLVTASKQSIHQEDLINFDLKRISLEGIDAGSDLYGKWSAIANKLTLDSLVMVDLRNKNKPRPFESPKKLFLGLLESIPFPLDLDTVILKNSRFDYQEIGNGKEKPGLIRFDNLNAQIEGFVTVDSLRKDREMKISLQSDFMGHTPLNAVIAVPYKQESFHLNMSLSPMDLTSLNSITEELAGVRIKSGKLHRLELQMNANEYSAQNELTFDFEDFHIEIEQKGDSQNVNKLASFAGNAALRKTNLPNQKSYRKARFQSSRNVYRGPFNFIWETSKTGITEIMPSEVGRMFLKNPENKKSKKKG